MKVSIIIPNYNGKRYLGMCLLALYKQSYKDYEVIVVDNGSVDDSCELIKTNYPYVKIVQLDQNYGFSKAVNEGIYQASGEYVVLLNNDTEVEEDWLKNLVKCIEQDKNIFSCSSKMLQYYERDKIDDAGDGYTVLGWAFKRGDGYSSSMYSKDEDVFSSCAGAAIYRKEILDVIGYFDESFFAYMEDVDISYRARIFGYKNIYCSGARVYHIGSGTSGSKYNNFKIRLAARNNIYVIYKNMPVLQLIMNSPFLIAGFFVKYIFYTIKGYEKDYREGLVEGLKGLRAIRRVEYDKRNLPNYIKIQVRLLNNTIKYLYKKFF